MNFTGLQPFVAHNFRKSYKNQLICTSLYHTIELGGIPVLVVTQGIDFIPVLFIRIPEYRF